MTAENQEQDALFQDKAEKLDLAIANIKLHCESEDQEDEILRNIGAALKAGDKLLGVNLEGSTNYTYKIYLEGKPNIALFVKVAFAYALWNPNRDIRFDLERGTTEFNMMKNFKKTMGDEAPVARPIYCQDICHEVRMLVCEFVESNLFSTQLFAGKVDRRIIPEIASFTAMINLEAYDDPSFNEGIKDSFRTLSPICRAAFGQILNDYSKECNHFITFAKEVGEERFATIIDAMMKEYDKQECLVHGDLHALNILVEPPDGDNFAKDGTYIVCDWELAHVGSLGRDSGSFYAWPVCSAFFLAAEGKKKEANDVLDFLDGFWNEYAKTLVEHGKKDAHHLRERYRSTIAWCGMYLFVGKYSFDIFFAALL